MWFSCSLCPLVFFKNFNLFLHKITASIGWLESAATYYLHKSSLCGWNWLFMEEEHFLQYLPLVWPHYIFYKPILPQETFSSKKTHLSFPPYNGAGLSCLLGIFIFTDLFLSFRFVFYITNGTLVHWLCKTMNDSEWQTILPPSR